MFYHVWITALTPFYEGEIITKLINLGYHVGPADGCRPSLTNPNAIGAVIALQIWKSEMTCAQLDEEIWSIITESKMKIYSYTITEFSSKALWRNGNFELEGLNFKSQLN